MFQTLWSILAFFCPEVTPFQQTVLWVYAITWLSQLAFGLLQQNDPELVDEMFPGFAAKWIPAGLQILSEAALVTFLPEAVALMLGALLLREVWAWHSGNPTWAFSTRGIAYDTIWAVIHVGFAWLYKSQQAEWNDNQVFSGTISGLYVFLRTIVFVSRIGLTLWSIFRVRAEPPTPAVAPVVIVPNSPNADLNRSCYGRVYA